LPLSLGISRQILENNFIDELKNGRARKLLQSLCLLDRTAKRGSVAAAKFLVNAFSNGTSLQRIGKKERTRLEAETALIGTEWEDIIRTPEQANHGGMGTAALRAKEYRQRKRHGRACFEIEADEILHWQQHQRVGRGHAPETRRYRHKACRNLRRNVDLAFDLGLGARF
jgi:hypothetical protein